MIYLKVDEDGNILYQHNMPFDETHGLGKSREELEQEGVFVNEIPEPEKVTGKIPLLKYNSESGLYYEYEDIPPTEIEKLEQKIDNAILELTTLIAMGGM